MKILHIIDSAGLYGAETMLLNLAEDQLRLAHTPIIASIREKNEAEQQLEDEAKRRGIQVIAFRMLDGPNLLGALRILRYAWSADIDIIHAHGYKGCILFGFLPKAIRRVPIVSTLHGWTNSGRLSKILLYEYLESLSLKFMDEVCVVNKAMIMHPWLNKMYSRLHIIHNGIPDLDIRDQPPSDEVTEFCKKGFTIASIGRLSQEKGYSYLIEAFDLFQKDTEEARLLIIGEGPERNNLEYRLKVKGLSEKAMLPGYRNKAWRYLHNCRAFVLSSLTEGLPMTLLEAMQVGTPVIATKVGGIPEVVKNGETGYLVSPKNPDEIARFLTGIYVNYQSGLSLASHAKELVSSEFSSMKMAERYIELYRNIGCIYSSI